MAGGNCVSGRNRSNSRLRTGGSEPQKKSEESKKIRYSKIIIVLALTVMTGMLAANIVLCWRSGQQLDSSSVVAMSGFWGTEVFASAWIKVTETKNQMTNQTIKKAQTETTPSGEPYEP